MTGSILQLLQRWKWTTKINSHHSAQVLQVAERLVLLLFDVTISRKIGFKIFGTGVLQCSATVDFKILDPDALQRTRSYRSTTMREQILASERVEQDGNDALPSHTRTVRPKLDHHKTLQRLHPSELRKPIAFNIFFDSLSRSDLLQFFTKAINKRRTFTRVSDLDGKIGAIATETVKNITSKLCDP